MLSVKKGQHQQRQQLTGFPAKAGVTVFASLASALLKLHIWRPKREGVCLIRQLLTKQTEERWSWPASGNDANHKGTALRR